MKKKLVGVVLLGCLFVGCISAATVASYLPIFEAAVNGVLALVKPTASAQVQADEVKMNAGVADLVAAIQGVQGSPSVSAALTVVESAATTLETDIGVSSNKDVQLATAILDLAIGTYQAIIQKAAGSVPAPVAMLMLPQAAVTRVHTATQSRPHATSTGDFKRQFNALCVKYNHPEMKMKLTMMEHLHIR